MAVMANPIIAETGWSQQWVYGALSLGILISGLLAPLCGRLIARAQGRRLLAASGAVMALGLVIGAEPQFAAVSVCLADYRRGYGDGPVWTRCSPRWAPYMAARRVARLPVLR